MEQEPVEQLVARRSVLRVAARYEARHPRWLVDHALAAGWLWAAFWVLLMLPADHFRWHASVWIVIVIVAVLPSFGATVDRAQPDAALPPQTKRVGARALLRALRRLRVAFIAWTLSVVLSATIAMQLQPEGKNNEVDTLGIGLSLLVSVLPVVILFLWLLLIFRYAWFLSRLRGWRAQPRHTRIPSAFLADAPRTHRMVVGLAHPALLAVTGSLAVLVALLLYVDDVTIHLV